MKRLVCLLCILGMLGVLLLGCSAHNSHCNENPTTEGMRYYSMEDFSDIVPGQSGISDLLQLGPCDTLVTSYGALFIYPTIDGKYIKVVLLGDSGELIVESIKCVDE